MSHFNIGDRVRVSTDRLYHGYRMDGYIGTVMSNGYNSSIAVKISGKHNNHSGKGYFYFDQGELVRINASTPDINNMEENKNMTRITNYLNAVRVQFADHSKPCRERIANFDPSLTIGDLCVVSDNGRYLLATVVEICESTGEELMAEVVTNVYTADYDNRVAARKAAAEIKAKMEARAKKLQDIALYQMLAKDDPEMAELLKNYQDIVQ